MANTRQELGRAFELIRKDQLEDAIAVVKPITEAEPENADAWWLLANAASEPRDARRALVNVLKINPSYPKARDLLDKLSELHPPRDDELMMMMEIADVEPTVPGGEVVDPFAELDADSDDPFQSSEGPPTSEIDDLFSEAEAERDASFDDDFGLDDEDPFSDLLAEDDKKAAKAGRRQRSGSGGRLRRVLLLLILLIVIAGGAAFVLLGGDDDTADTEVAENTEPVVLEPVDPETINAENATQLEDIRRTVETEAQATVGQDASAFYVQVDGGYSLLVRVCAEATPALSRIAVDGMGLVARRVGNTPAVQSDLTMVGVSVHDCARDNDTLYRAMSEMAAVQTLANSPGSDEAFISFQQSWVIER